LCLRATSPYSGAEWERQWRESEPGDLPGKFSRIVSTLENEASTVAKLVEEAQRQAEIEHQRWEIQHQQWLKEEAERRRVQNIKDSREQLFKVIESWNVVIGIERFFESVESRIALVSEEDRGKLHARLQRARELIGSIDAMDYFRSWKAPEER
jgi:hypothetical protein